MRCILDAIKIDVSPSVTYHVELKGLHPFPVSRSYSSDVSRPQDRPSLWTESPVWYKIHSLGVFFFSFFFFSFLKFCICVLQVWVMSANLFSFWDILKSFPDKFPIWCKLCLSLQEFLHYLIGTILLLIASIVAASKSYNLSGLVAGAVRLCLLVLTLLKLQYTLNRALEIYYL